jgi:hypothetical protein
MSLTVNQNKMECYILETGDHHQAATGRDHVVVIVTVLSPAVAAVAAVGEVVMRRSQTS